MLHKQLEEIGLTMFVAEKVRVLKAILPNNKMYSFF